LARIASCRRRCPPAGGLDDRGRGRADSARTVWRGCRPGDGRADRAGMRLPQCSEAASASADALLYSTKRVLLQSYGQHQEEMWQHDLRRLEEAGGEPRIGLRAVRATAEIKITEPLPSSTIARPPATPQLAFHLFTVSVRH